MRHVMYKTGNFIFNIESEIPVPSAFKKFETEEQQDSFYNYIIRITDSVIVSESAFDVRKDETSIILQNGLEKRYLYIKGDKIPYAVSVEKDSSCSVIYVAEKYLEYFKDTDSMFISLLSLERRLQEKNEFILHSSFVMYNNEAVLFTAPSGTGKSTQAELWKKYRNARVINGDRTVLSIKDRVLYASGSPHCGSSGITENASFPVKAVIMLSQAEDNSIYRATYMNNGLSLFKEITVNYHNDLFFNKAITFTENIFSLTDVYLLKCNISEEAVTCLYNALYCNSLLP